MKKALAIFLLSAYLLVTCGVVINHHYCMNQLESTQLFQTSGDYCGLCGMHQEDAGDCCRDEIRIFKLEQDQKPATSLLVDFRIPFNYEAGLTTTSPAILLTCDSSPTRKYYDPPPLSRQDTHLRNSVFRI